MQDLETARAGTPGGSPGAAARASRWPGSWRVRLHQIPDGGQDCDHRYQSQGYQPGPVLRRLIQIRDGECAMPCCA
ncbi:MAG TPA: hypothetical protein VFB06_04290, partial [Streptosporangiaceae bacterium]|nr:hypothetical protein [Streptosporangiaceae bacterium]